MMRPNKDQSSTMDFEIGGSATSKSSTKYAKNQWSGHSNDGRLVQMNQQPNRKGNDGSCHHSGMAQGGKKPQSSVPDTHAKGAYGMPQYRGVGGTPMPKTGRTEFNVGRGPTKGNQQ